MYFTKKQAEVFENQLMNFWQNKNDKRWFWLGFQALEKSGLTYYENDQEEMMVRERLVILCIIYYEYCIQNGYNISTFKDWDAELIYKIKRDFSVGFSDQMLEVTNALIKYFGDEQIVSFELNYNCEEGQANRFFRLNEMLGANDFDFEKQSESDFWSAIYKYDYHSFMCISI